MTYQEQIVSELIGKTERGEIQWVGAPFNDFHDDKVFKASINTLLINIRISKFSGSSTTITITKRGLETMMPINIFPSEAPNLIRLAELAEHQSYASAEAAHNQRLLDVLGEIKS